VAVASKFLAVGSVVPWAQAEVGAIATQAWGNPTYGPKALELLASGVSVEKAVETLTSDDEGRARRQVGLVDAWGKSAAFTGGETSVYAGHLTGEGFTVQGNLLAGPEVLRAMADSFRVTQGTLGERLLAALSAGQMAGGDRRGQQSAALLVVRRGGGYGGFNDRYIDLRVDDHYEPIKELARLFALHERSVQAIAHVRFGVELKKSKRLDAAQREFALAVRLAQKYSTDHALANRLAWNLAIQDEMLDEALALVKQAIAGDSLVADYWDTRAEIHARRQQYDAAIIAQTKALQLDPEQIQFHDRLKKWQELAKGLTK
jgi:uncharacterized Ntn-hydrolase superfamily protein